MFWILVFVLNPSLVSFVLCSGKFEFRLPATVHSPLRLCLRQLTTASRPQQLECTFGETFSDSSFARLHFTFRWTGSFSLIVELNNERTLLLSEEEAAPDHRWKARQVDQVRVEFRISCDLNYHGHDCATFCRPRDDTFGHYLCASDGRKVCQRGWKGDNCDAPQCREHCNEMHGFCTLPHECTCRNGWKGELCDQCVEYPGCLHGYCLAPFQCQCHRNWGGILCDQDLNYCGTHQPCLNHGQCVNVAPDHYRCECAQGFAGINCQTIVDACATQPCLHAGQCRSLANGTAFRCECAQGFHGERCERDLNECLSSPCLHGATCHDLNSRFQCQCAPGWTGARCEQDVNECLQEPCVHANHCLNTPGAFTCLCLQGFEGAHCESEVDDCHDVTCLNGGTCLDLFHDFRCDCRPGFSGAKCERLDPNACLANDSFWTLDDNDVQNDDNSRDNCSKTCFCFEKQMLCSECPQRETIAQCSAEETTLVLATPLERACVTLARVHSLVSPAEEFCCSEASPTSLRMRVTSSMAQKLKTFPKVLRISSSERKNAFLWISLVLGFSLLSIVFFTFFVIFRRKKRRETRETTEEVVINCIQNNLKSEKNLRNSENSKKNVI